MKLPIFQAAFAAAVFVCNHQTDAASVASSSHRELYAECRENGQFVPMGTHCCHETTDIQYSMANIKEYNEGEGKCDQVNYGDLTARFDTYCSSSRKLDGTTHGECNYDVLTDNAECAENHKKACAAHGGSLFQEDIVLECEQFDHLIKIQNSLVCLGSSCDDHDVTAYLWATDINSITSGIGGGSCRIVSVHDETLKEFKQHDARHSALFVGSLICAFLLFGVGGKVWMAHRRRQLEGKEPLETETMTNNNKELAADVVSDSATTREDPGTLAGYDEERPSTCKRNVEDLRRGLEELDCGTETGSTSSGGDADDDDGVSQAEITAPMSQASQEEEEEQEKPNMKRLDDIDDVPLDDPEQLEAGGGSSNNEADAVDDDDDDDDVKAVVSGELA